VTEILANGKNIIKRGTGFDVFLNLHLRPFLIFFAMMKTEIQFKYLKGISEVVYKFFYESFFSAERRID
jgi:hypothetical protein